MVRFLRLFTLLLLAPLLADCSHAQPASLADVLARGELRVLALPSAVAYLPGEEQALGFDQDLAQRFAEELGVKIRFTPPTHPEEIPTLLAAGQADLAAGVVITPARTARLRFGPDYEQVRARLVYRNGAPRPKGKAADLVGQRLAVRAGSYHESLLETLQAQTPDLSWVSYPVQDSLELLELTNDGQVDFALVDDQLFEQTQRYYPQLREGPLMGKPRPKAWALSPNSGSDLQLAVDAFFKRLEKGGELATTATWRASTCWRRWPSGTAWTSASIPTARCSRRWPIAPASTGGCWRPSATRSPTGTPTPSPPQASVG